ncbi:MAG TPA: histidine phosphatase family protein [Thermodesulfovibrionia bacterium]|nr:histidine phosphatase family protein [Thermodesulfovibrionia bacterium]
MKRVTQLFMMFLLSTLAVCVYAQSVDMQGLVAALKQGGYVIVFRHGATNRDQADTDPLNHDNIAKQRHLSAQGKETAKQIGEVFKKQGIPIGKVYTSKFYRAIETGKLISGGDVTSSLDITEGGLVVTPIENERRAEAFKKLVGTIPEAGKNTLIVTHKPNIVDAFGKDWFDVKEGEASIFKPDSSGKAELVARVQAVDWIKANKGN